MAAKSKDVAKTAAYSEEELVAVTSFDEALTLAVTKHGKETVVTASDELGDGFKMLENKDQLIKVPMIVLTWDFHMGNHGEFATMKVVTKDNQKYIVNDGSSGIRDQLMGFTAKHGRSMNLYCEKGLSRSDYTHKDEDGTETPASTYYLDTSA